jgi:hypothetical protein
MRSKHYEDFFLYGLRDGKVVHIKDVPNGIACGCICPNCEEPLVAHNNPHNKKAAHFRHHSLVDCMFAYESALHLAAKALIEETKSLIVPEVTFGLSEMAVDYQYISEVTKSRGTKKGIKKHVKKRKVEFDTVELEKGHGDFRPDLRCTKGDRVLYVEIAVTHFIDDVKRAKIREANIPVLEIDISDELLISKEADMERLKEIITRGDISYMKWINNPKQEKLREALRDTEVDIAHYINHYSSYLKTYGRDYMIYNCPIHKEHRFVNLYEECSTCKYFCDRYMATHSEDGKLLHRIETHIGCLGHRANQFDDYVAERQPIKQERESFRIPDLEKEKQK